MPGAFTQFILPTFDLHTGYKQKDGKKLTHSLFLLLDLISPFSLNASLYSFKLSQNLVLQRKVEYFLPKLFSGNRNSFCIWSTIMKTMILYR